MKNHQGQGAYNKALIKIDKRINNKLVITKIIFLGSSEATLSSEPPHLRLPQLCTRFWSNYQLIIQIISNKINN